MYSVHVTLGVPAALASREAYVVVLKFKLIANKLLPPEAMLIAI
jgi:hypothetical protein